MHKTLNPEGWKPARGYANGMVAKGQTIFLAGQIGWDGNQEFQSDDFVEQTRQALANIVTLLGETGATPDNLVRLTWFITSRDEYLAAQREIGDAYRDTLGRVFPTMSVVEVTSLMEARARVEIEATAVIPE